MFKRINEERDRIAGIDKYDAFAPSSILIDCDTAGIADELYFHHCLNCWPGILELAPGVVVVRASGRDIKNGLRIYPNLDGVAYTFTVALPPSP
jgi:hypothetical protein